ncbi:MAG: PilZ domain-containing protein [Gammaproteobacteria bacterium]|nr:PilZ domain-containing protein [Gammaproteobacteria bacterium]MBT8133930.1 PilZ domain-containing protein [Gammaproteobacteria bacterium]NNJ49106.1 PilZ domain-containing protein [Gammaproteobacteria bacterium]
MSENQRRFPREEIQIEVELRFLEENARTVITRDMSEGGLFLRLNDAAHYPMGEMVNLRFKNPLDDYAHTQKDAIIVRHTEEGMGVAFIEMEEF